ncbi:MAG TPA: bifunctional YncE family protein/alkaline phosphatase family protein [Gemmatimonadaceae bacterium]|nr:bifunctional YncE family protein/alkaline phosphatase family protein [Gemmatimonadaceae bacterium]
MIVPLLLALQAGAQQPRPRPPQRPLADPGVIAVEQRVTPAGVQSVFDGKVGGVRFGRNPGELWVAVPGAAYRLAWRDNRTITSAAFDGRAGVHGVAIDPMNGRAIISSVGRLAGNAAQSRTPGAAPLARAQAVAHLKAYAADTGWANTGDRADSARVVFVSPPLGDFMAGGPAVAARENASGHRVAVLPLPANDSLAVLDADNGARLHSVPLGVLPVSAVVSADGSTAWVSVLGGPKPKSGERAAAQCCDPRAEPVRVDARDIAERGTVTQVDLVNGRVTASVTVGRHPTGLAWDESRGRLFVANGNSDDVSIVDTRTAAVIGTITADPFRERRIGIAPTAVVLADGGRRLYVTLGGANAVAVYDASTADGLPTRFRGLIPTGWYPSSIDVSADGRTIAVGTLFGMGSGTGNHNGQRGRYVHAVRGSVNVIDVPTDAQLDAYTTSVAQNNRRHLATSPDASPSIVARTGVAPQPVPERPGEPSPIQHVVYIIRENRTYDQVLGDMGKGASDSSLVMYGRAVTPNAHALSEQFVLLDHFFASGGNSADGHNWLTQANETDYPMWPLYYGRSYPSEGVDALAYSSGGFLWEAAEAKGKSVTVFGEYAPSIQEPKAALRTSMLTQYRDRQPHDPAFFRGLMKQTYDTRSDIRSLDKLLVREYPGWTMDSPDVVKADVIIDHLREWEARKSMPNLVMVILPSDHTVGTSAGWCTPKACVADNDLALGRIVDALSHSTFWKSMAILSVEDDAQDGVDHIDGHRTVALVASPYARRGVIDSTYYAQPSLVKTIELMLGLPALSAFDLVATDMRASFLGAADQPDFTPYTALVPAQSIYEVNQRVGDIRGPDAGLRRTAALASARMRFDTPDAAPSERLNRILWRDARGWRTPYPAVKQSLFFPMSISIADEDRDEVEEKKERR